jgi:hypothetical protein
MKQARLRQARMLPSYVIVLGIVLMGVCRVIFLDLVVLVR